MQLETERLLLRRFEDADGDAFARMNADPRVMKFFPDVLTRSASDAFLARIAEHHQAHGFGFVAMVTKDSGACIGMTGLAHVGFEAPFTPAVEIGWRLSPEYWGHGYASEAAGAVKRFGFAQLGLSEIVAFTFVGNTKSRRVMERLGMKYNPTDDFLHPRLPAAHALSEHVLYRARTSLR